MPPGQGTKQPKAGASITVVLRLEGARARQGEIVGLRRTQRRQLDPELVEMEGSDLLVEVLGQHIDLVLVLAVIGPQLDLGEHLVGE